MNSKKLLRVIYKIYKERRESGLCSDSSLSFANDDWKQSKHFLPYVDYDIYELLVELKNRGYIMMWNAKGFELTDTTRDRFEERLKSEI